MTTLRWNAVLSLLIVVALAHAADEPLPTAIHRIVGLCYPERAEDLKAEFKERTDVKLVSVDYDKAEATFAYDPKRVSADSLSHLGGNREFQIRPRSTIPFDQLTRLDIAVVGLDCKGCALATYNAIGRLDGVFYATVDYRTGVVSTRIDPAKTNREALVEALKKANVTLKPADAETK